MKILIACEESQTVCKAFRALGHEAYSCDIQESSGGHPEWHKQEDVLEHMAYNEYDMVIAFPPCTHLAVSGAKHFEKKRKDGRQREGINFFMEFFREERNIKYLAVENPIGIMSSQYRTPDQIIQPYMFGDPVKKSTCLWLKNLPTLKATNNVESDVKYYISKNGAKMSEWNARQIVVNGKKCGYNTEEFKKHRSKTFQGIADAMAEQWGSIEDGFKSELF